VIFPSPVQCLALDPAERAIYVGTPSAIHQFPLYYHTRDGYVAVEGDQAHPLQARGGEFVGHAAGVTAVNLSFDGTLLVSGDASGEVFVWDIGSRQVLRKLKEQNGTQRRMYCVMSLNLFKGPITVIIPFIQPDEMVPLPNELQQLKRLQSERGRMEHDVLVVIPKGDVSEDEDESESVAEGLRALTEEGSEARLKGRVFELEDELKRIYGAYGELRGLHEKLWQKYVDKS
jgi:pre-rRNA-processing protein IPI3